MFVQTIQIKRANPQISIIGLFPLHAEIMWCHYIQSSCLTIIDCYLSPFEKATIAYVTDIMSHMFTIQRLPARGKTFFAIRHARVS